MCQDFAGCVRATESAPSRAEVSLCQDLQVVLELQRVHHPGLRSAYVPGFAGRVRATESAPSRAEVSLCARICRSC